MKLHFKCCEAKASLLPWYSRVSAQCVSIWQTPQFKAKVLIRHVQLHRTCAQFFVQFAAGCTRSNEQLSHDTYEYSASSCFISIANYWRSLQRVTASWLCHQRIVRLSKRCMVAELQLWQHYKSS